MFCFGCPPTINRMIGDEGVDSPMPYVLEGPLGLSKPCFENKPVRNKTPKILPLGSGPQGDGGVRFRGLALPLDTLVQIQNGEVATDRRTLKGILYGEQMGRCAGCGDATRFHNLETDRIIPGSSGGCYIVWKRSAPLWLVQPYQGESDHGVSSTADERPARRGLTRPQPSRCFRLVAQDHWPPGSEGT